MFQRILVPIDGSRASSDALMKALELAKVHGSEVEILHVMTFSEDVPKETTTGSPPEWVEDYVSRVGGTMRIC